MSVIAIHLQRVSVRRPAGDRQCRSARSDEATGPRICQSGFGRREMTNDRGVVASVTTLAG
jgi:hypothetical protein